LLTMTDSLDRIQKHPRSTMTYSRAHNVSDNQSGCKSFTSMRVSHFRCEWKTNEQLFFVNINIQCCSGNHQALNQICII
jgi:hypothetical protein